jgi:replicative DNA helicase
MTPSLQTHPMDNASSHQALPHSIQFEKSVLSCIFQWEDLEGVDSLTEEHFYHPAHQLMFRTLMSESKPIDLIKVTQGFLNRGELASVGGPAAVTEIYTYLTNSQRFADYVKDLHVFKARRFAIQAATELSLAAYDMTDEEGYLELSSAPMTNIGDIASAASKARDKKQVLIALTKSIEGRMTGKVSPMGLLTGISEFDYAFQGLHPQRMIVISGYPTSGKTVLAVQALWNIALNGDPTLFISLEMPDHKIAERNLIIASGLPCLAVSDPRRYSMEKWGNKNPAKEQMVAINKGLKLLRDRPMYWEDPTAPTIAQVEAIIRRNHRKHGIKAVAIDYIQLMRGRKSKGGSKEQEVADISHTLQGLMKELGIHLLLLSQQNKEGGTKYAEAIAEDADGIVSIIQDRDPLSKDFGKHLGMGIRKDRHNGNTGDFLPVILNKEMLKFETIQQDNQ